MHMHIGIILLLAATAAACRGGHSEQQAASAETTASTSQSVTPSAPAITLVGNNHSHVNAATVKEEHGFNMSYNSFQFFNVALWQLNGNESKGEQHFTLMAGNEIDNETEHRVHDQSQLAKSGNTIELLICLDFQLYISMRSSIANGQLEFSVQQYFSMLIGYANTILNHNGSYPFKITLIPAAIVVPESAEQNWWPESHTLHHEGKQYINATGAITSFSHKLKQLHRTSSSPSLHYDHAIAITDLPLLSSGEPVDGVAFFGSMCHGCYSLSLVRDAGALASASTIVHELLHSMKVVHTGEDKTCEASAGFLMDKASKNSKHMEQLSLARRGQS